MVSYNFSNNDGGHIMEKKLLKVFAISLLLSAPIFAAEDDAIRSIRNSAGDLMDIRPAQQVVTEVAPVVTEVAPVVTEVADVVAEVAPVVTEVAEKVAPVVTTVAVEETLKEKGFRKAGELKVTAKEKAEKLRKTLKFMMDSGFLKAADLQTVITDMAKNPLANKANWAIAGESGLAARALYVHQREAARKAGNTSWFQFAKDNGKALAFFAFNVWLTNYVRTNFANLKNPKQVKQFAKTAFALGAKLGIHWIVTLNYLRNINLKGGPKALPAKAEEDAK